MAQVRQPVSSQFQCQSLPFEWPKFLGNGPMASALLRRLLHKCHTITFPKGVNLSKPQYALPPAEMEP